MNVDVIILTKSDTEKKIRMTRRTILTLKESETEYNFKIHLVESGQDVNKQYKNLLEN